MSVVVEKVRVHKEIVALRECCGGCQSVVLGYEGQELGRGAVVGDGGSVAGFFKKKVLGVLGWKGFGIARMAVK